MKKIMILVLSLAVLFGFAACDNSNGTPAGDSSTGLTDGVILRASSKVITAMQGDGDIFDLLGASTPSNILAIANQTSKMSDDYETLTITKTITPAVGETVPAETVTLVVNGIDTSATTDDGTTGKEIKVTFDDFDYTYSGYILGKDGNYVSVTATVNGLFANSGVAKVALNAEKAISTVTLSDANLKVVLPKDSTGVSLTIGEDSADSAFYDFVNEAFDKDNTSNTDKTTSYSAYVTAADTENQAKVASFVAALLNNSTNSVKFVDATLVGWVNTAAPTGGSWSRSYKPENGGSATFEYTPATDTILATAASSDEGDIQIKLAANDKLTVTFAGEGTDAAPSSFVPKTFTISGKLSAFTYDGDSAFVANADFDKFDVAISGDVESGLTSIEGNSGAVTKITSSAAVLTPDDGTASATMAVGPELTTKTEDNVTTASLVSALVTVDYAE